MVKHTNCLSVFDHFMGVTVKGFSLLTIFMPMFHFCTPKKVWFYEKIFLTFSGQGVKKWNIGVKWLNLLILLIILSNCLMGCIIDINMFKVSNKDTSEATGIF